MVFHHPRCEIPQRRGVHDDVSRRLGIPFNAFVSSSTSKVLFKLLARLDYENWLSISQETLAEEIGMKQPNVARAIRDLVQTEILEVSKDDTDKRRNSYRLNANLGWRGDARQWARHQQTRTGSNVISMPGLFAPK